MNRLLPVTLAGIVAGVTLLSAAPKFTSTWRAPGVATVSFAGKKIAALVISKDDSLRVSGEEALVRELTARGLQSVATYRIAPKEELQKAETAKGWFEKANIEGVVALRPVSKDKSKSYTPSLWVNPNYSSLWGYYGYGWGTVYTFGAGDPDTVVVVETTIYSLSRNELLWAGVSETKNPKNLQVFVEELVKETVKQLHEQGLARSVAK